MSYRRSRGRGRGYNNSKHYYSDHNYRNSRGRNYNNRYGRGGRYSRGSRAYDKYGYENRYNEHKSYEEREIDVKRKQEHDSFMKRRRFRERFLHNWRDITANLDKVAEDGEVNILMIAQRPSIAQKITNVLSKGDKIDLEGIYKS